MPRETERQMYKRLHAKYGDAPAQRRRAPAADEPDDDQDEGIYVLAGKHADSFLDRMFGSASNTDPDDDDDDDDDEPDDDDDVDDPPSRAGGSRFFGGRGGRG